MRAKHRFASRPKSRRYSQDSLELDGGLRRQHRLAFDDFVDRLLRSTGPVSELRLRHARLSKHVDERFAGRTNNIRTVFAALVIDHVSPLCRPPLRLGSREMRWLRR